MDKELFVQEIEACSTMMYRVAYTILRNSDECRDALQEAALKAWEKRRSLLNEKFFTTWLTRILINECYTIRRKRRRIISLEEAPEQSSPPPDPTLALALQALPEKLRLPLVLRFAEGMDEAEIAKVLHLPNSTVRGRIYRAKKQLRKELEA
jgi:RNA polymerase sigma-70 factor (ECF subfamily)